MDKTDMKINIENVGIFRGKYSLDLKKGVNLLKAPNAKGKTSFTRAMELFLIPESELNDKGYYMNLFATAPDEQIKIELISEENRWERRFRKPQKKNNLLAVSEEPFPLKGINLANLCFATPENELINSILFGKTIREYIEIISGSKSYEIIIKSLENHERNLRRQYQKYKDDLIRLEETRKTLEIDKNEKNKSQKELDKLPKIDEEQLLKSTELRDLYLEKKNEKKHFDNIIRQKKGQIESLDQQINDLKVDIKRQTELIAEIEKEHPKITEKIEEEKDLMEDQTKLYKGIDQNLLKIDDQLKSINDNWVKRKKYGEEKCYACGRPLTLKELQDWEKRLESSKNDYSQKLKEVKRKIEDFKDEINRLQIQERELSIQSTNLAKNEKMLSRKELDLDKLRKELDSDLKAQKALQKDIDKLLENVSEEIIEIKKQREKLEDRIQILEAKVVETIKRIKGLEEDTKGAEILTKKIEFLENGVGYLNIRKEEINKKAANKFNERINELYNKLGFSDFKEIKINEEDYKIYITREKDGIIMSDWPLEALSTSERYTLGITFLVAAKEEYLPEVPFFVIDEIITSYDKDRIQKLIEYIKNITDYVIITQLEPQSTLSELTIEHLS